MAFMAMAPTAVVVHMLSVNSGENSPPSGGENSPSLESLSGIVERVTFHNEQNGWSVLKVSSFRDVTPVVVIVHQAKVFAGATMEFWGQWVEHSKYGRQFKAVRALEKKPASAAALEKYLGSGLIKGVGPFTAKRIVSYFKDRTFEVFENSIEELMQVPGIASKKLAFIRESWEEHRAIRDVMIFLQKYGISTLFATKIYKTYRDDAISIVSENPYRLAQDIYGIGFFSADKVALSMGFERMGVPRIAAGMKHVLASSRDKGHCYLKEDQILTQTTELLSEDIPTEKLKSVLDSLVQTQEVRFRRLEVRGGESIHCFYSKTLYFDEIQVAHLIKRFVSQSIKVDEERIRSWVSRYCQKNEMLLSEEQEHAVCTIPSRGFSILTGGPGCGKTTCTKALVALLQAMKLRVTLVAPTGRAAQRMTEVIGLESKTIHRLLGWVPAHNHFQKNEQDPLETDFVVLDEASMLDISLAAHLLKAIPPSAQVLFIGDPDQLPSVGAGRVLADLLESDVIPSLRLTQVFRQAQASSIIRFAHDINGGRIPKIISPIHNPHAYEKGNDCLFLDANEATQDQMKFIRQVRGIANSLGKDGRLLKFKDEWVGKMLKSMGGEGAEIDEVEVDKLYRPPLESDEEVRRPALSIPEKFRYVDISKLANSKSEIEELMSVLKSVHPWSSLHFGMTAVDTVLRVYTQSIEKWLGRKSEIQILTPQVRGSLGTINLNESIQKLCNPESPMTKQVQMGYRVLRVHDRVIQTRNNYDLGVFNGDIGRIVDLDMEKLLCTVLFSGGTEEREVVFQREDLIDIQLAYAITVHKSQGSEFEVVIIPVLGQHFNMLFRNLIYTGLTRAKKLAIFVGSRKALSMAIRQVDSRERQTALKSLIEGH